MASANGNPWILLLSSNYLPTIIVVRSVAILLILCATISTGQRMNNSTDTYFTNTGHMNLNYNEKKSEILSMLFGNDYDPDLRPTGENGTGPVIVTANLQLKQIENFDDTAMEYKVQIVFRQEWLDPRLTYEHLQSNVKYLQVGHSRKIWMPDIFFSNEKHAVLHDIITPNWFTRIYPSGVVLQSYRITLLLSCPMNLKAYPMDAQTCPVKFASYGWTTEDLILKWKVEMPVEIKPHQLNLANFILVGYSALTGCQDETSTGVYSCLVLFIRIEREFGFYVIQIYIPCAMLVIVSWISFWLEPTAVEARVSLGVTTILTIVTQTYGINKSVPPASYVKAVDIWTAACQVMVFSALIEFAIVNYLSNSHMLRTLPKSSESAPSIVVESNNVLQIQKFLLRAKRLDIISRILFPAVFILFNLTYWLTYLVIAPKYFSKSL